ncbi:MAG: dihydrodipicolinate synthase family protein [Phycisphaerales bacterium]
MTTQQSIENRCVPLRLKHHRAGIFGIVPPMVTPLAGRDKLDLPGVERLIEHILAGGVHGLFILGTTGEGPSLSNRLEREVIERTCSRSADWCVGVTDPLLRSHEASPAPRRRSWGLGGRHCASAVLFPSGQPELTEYYLQIASQMPLPVVPWHAELYKDPHRTEHAPDTVGSPQCCD